MERSAKTAATVTDAAAVVTGPGRSARDRSFHNQQGYRTRREPFLISVDKRGGPEKSFSQLWKQIAHSSQRNAERGAETTVVGQSHSSYRTFRAGARRHRDRCLTVTIARHSPQKIAKAGLTKSLFVLMRRLRIAPTPYGSSR
jgi:hypothetical protein